VHELLPECAAAGIKSMVGAVSHRIDRELSRGRT
jgi:hypothetical protein